MLYASRTEGLEKPALNWAKPPPSAAPFAIGYAFKGVFLLLLRGAEIAPACYGADCLINARSTTVLTVPDAVFTSGGPPRHLDGLGRGAKGHLKPTGTRQHRVAMVDCGVERRAECGGEGVRFAPSFPAGGFRTTRRQCGRGKLHDGSGRAARAWCCTAAIRFRGGGFPRISVVRPGQDPRYTNLNSCMAARTVATAIALILSSPSAWAQVDTGAILGIVTDASGSAVAGASISVRHKQTNQEIYLRTNNSGLYSAPALRPGEYTVAALKDGFRPQQSQAFDLRVQDRIEVDFRLEVGPANSEITVDSSVGAIDANSNSRGDVVEQRAI